MFSNQIVTEALELHHRQQVYHRRNCTYRNRGKLDRNRNSGVIIMEINNVYLKNKMKIGVIGISGKGKSTFLNHLIEKDVADQLGDLVGSKSKETKTSGQTKNPVRYHINRAIEGYSCKVSRKQEEKIIEVYVELSEVAVHAISSIKCTVTIEARPSAEFDKIMEENNLIELEFIDTQGLLDSLNEEVQVPSEIKDCALLLYLYDPSDQGSRGDYIAKYRNFLNSISDKPLIFLETNTQWLMLKLEVENDLENASERLAILDDNFSIPENIIRERYEELTGKSDYRSNETFILTSVLSASESSVNFYKVKLPNEFEDIYFDKCIRICSAHALRKVFSRLKSLKQSLEVEFERVRGQFQHSNAFKACYGLLSDVFVYSYQRIDYNSNAQVLRYARHDYTRFKKALKALQNGGLFNVSLKRIQKEINTEYGYHFPYETYENQDVLDCMQLLLDLYRAYLRKVKVVGNNLSKAFQVHLEKSVTSDYMCRDTGYDIPILDEETFLYCMKEIKKWIKDIPVQSVVYVDYDKFDVDYYGKDRVIYLTEKQVGSVPSLITKLDYACMLINNKMHSLAIESLMKNTANGILEEQI